MARRIFYRVVNDGKNFISGEEWEEIHSLQRWYNSEFFWTGGKLNFKRFVIFPNYELVGAASGKIREEFSKLEKTGYSEEEIVDKLESRGLIIVKRGGYEDGMIGSGFTRVADNEFNAFLVLDFLVKVSCIATTSALDVFDEGSFVKTHSISLNNGGATVKDVDLAPEVLEEIKSTRRVFAIVNPDKYDGHSEFTNYVNNFNDLRADERAKIVEDWNWLGHESKTSFDFNGDDFFGFDLNKKLRHLYFI
ncbi:MAG TPA: hypothetical protein VLX91_12875 [Candidatus Acidoferrales bacterium]|nr:hypothetical protein [Candidatus Acidoferrales bacterium]